MSKLPQILKSAPILIKALSDQQVFSKAFSQGGHLARKFSAAASKAPSQLMASAATTLKSSKKALSSTGAVLAKGAKGAAGVGAFIGFIDGLEEGQNSASTVIDESHDTKDVHESRISSLAFSAIPEPAEPEKTFMHLSLEKIDKSLDALAEQFKDNKGISEALKEIRRDYDTNLRSNLERAVNGKANVSKTGSQLLKDLTSLTVTAFFHGSKELGFAVGEAFSIAVTESYNEIKDANPELAEKRHAPVKRFMDSMITGAVACGVVASAAYTINKELYGAVSKDSLKNTLNKTGKAFSVAATKGGASVAVSSSLMRDSTSEESHTEPFSRTKDFLDKLDLGEEAREQFNKLNDFGKADKFPMATVAMKLAKKHPSSKELSSLASAALFVESLPTFVEKKVEQKLGECIGCLTADASDIVIKTARSFSDKVSAYYKQEGQIPKPDIDGDSQRRRPVAIRSVRKAVHGLQIEDEARSGQAAIGRSSPIPSVRHKKSDGPGIH